jgi:TPR repeat protein
MRQHLLPSFFILQVLVPWASALPQTPDLTQQASIRPERQSPKWTRADEVMLLAKAQRGDPSTQMWLASAYEQGWFGSMNYPEALKWFRRSAGQGDPDAQNSLGQMYENGEGVTQNYTLAAKWYRRAAEHYLGGAGQGRNNLGMLYLSGQGVPRDYLQAYMWFKLSGFNSNPNLSVTKAQMMPAQVVEAERLVTAWKTQHLQSE